MSIDGSNDQGVQFGTRPLTDAERGELAQPVYFTIKSLWWERAIACVGWLIVAVFLAGLAGAFYLGSTGLSGWIKGLTLLGMALCALGAISFLYRAVRALFPRPPALIRPALPADVREWQTTRVVVRAALRVITGDDDRETLLIRTSDASYFVLCRDGLSELWPDERTAWKRLPEAFQIRQIPGVDWRVRFEGPALIPVGEIDATNLPSTPVPTRDSEPWFYRDEVEIAESELEPEVVARFRAAAGPEADPG